MFFSSVSFTKYSKPTAAISAISCSCGAEQQKHNLINRKICICRMLGPIVKQTYMPLDFVQMLVRIRYKCLFVITKLIIIKKDTQVRFPLLCILHAHSHRHTPIDYFQALMLSPPPELVYCWFQKKWRGNNSSCLRQSYSITLETSEQDLL